MSELENDLKPAESVETAAEAAAPAQAAPAEPAREESAPAQAEQAAPAVSKPEPEPAPEPAAATKTSEPAPEAAPSVEQKAAPADEPKPAAQESKPAAGREPRPGGGQQRQKGEPRPPKREGEPGQAKGGEKQEKGQRPERGERGRGGERGERGDRGDRRERDPRGREGRSGRDHGRPGGRSDAPIEIDLEKLVADSLYLDNQAHAIVSRIRDMDAGTRSQVRRLFSAVRRACRAQEAERQHQFVMLRARLAYTIARHQLRSLDPLERLLLQVTRKNDPRGYERFRDLFEAIVAYNE